jgi:uncharacterized damage-inducible protein DinB
VRSVNGELLRDAFGHHVWATMRLIDACDALTEEQLEAAVGGTYGSIIDTMRHLVGGDAGYLFVLTDGRVANIDEATLDLHGLRGAMERNSSAWDVLLTTDLDPTTDVVRHRDDGSESHAPLGVRLAQALHHGTDHRSQICTTLTTLGIEPPDIDVWAFASLDGRLRQVPAPS